MPRIYQRKVKAPGILAFLSGFVLMLVVGWVVFPMVLYSEKTQPINFSHVKHGSQVGLTCDDCHSFRPDGTFAGIPRVSNCAECHQVLNTFSPDEKILLEEFIQPGKEIPWHVYSRQPICVYFSHAPHVKMAELECRVCHGPKDAEDKLPAYEENRLTGYSREIWGKNISGWSPNTWDSMKMTDCGDCHSQRGVSNHCFVCHK